MTPDDLFISEDTGCTYAVLLGQAILSLRPGGAWEIHPVGSVSWDSLHQKLYRDRRWIEPLSPEAAARLPPLPSLENITPPRWEDSFQPLACLPAALLPRLAARIPPGTRLPIQVVLHEDLWETRHGDGELHYLRSVHLDEQEAREAARRLDATDGSRGHLRCMVAAHRPEAGLCIPDFALQSYDHCSVPDIIRRLEAHLSPPPSPTPTS